VKLFFFFFLSVIATTISAQVSPDSVPAGVISVKRPAVKPAYRVEMSVMYEESKGRRRVAEISPQQITFSDSTFNASAPQPSTEYALGVLQRTDSAFNLNIKPAANSLTENKFDWQYYLAHIPYTFEWTDSTKQDSIRFIYSIDKRGNATCKPLPWRNADSTNAVFEKAASPYLIKLRGWNPARRAKKLINDGSAIKTKRVPCTVILTVYAYDPNAGRLLPIEVGGH
jgi:hypothetical protein